MKRSALALSVAAALCLAVGTMVSPALAGDAPARPTIFEGQAGVEGERLLLLTGPEVGRFRRFELFGESESDKASRAFDNNLGRANVFARARGLVTIRLPDGAGPGDYELRLYYGNDKFITLPIHLAGVGDAQVVGGAGSTAADSGSIAVGTNATATGLNSAAFGTNTTADGDNSFATGLNTTASGLQGTTHGEGSQALGDNSLAAGLNTAANGLQSVALGDSTNASGENALAGGRDTDALGDLSVAFGEETVAAGIGAVAFGYRTSASGFGSAAFGAYTQAIGENSVAFGQNSVAGGRCSVVLGHSASTPSQDPTSFQDSNLLLQVGNGFNNYYSDALALRDDGVMTVAGSIAETAEPSFMTSIAPLSDSGNVLTRVGNLDPFYFSFDANIQLPSGRQIGISASDMSSEFPELVITQPDGNRAVAYGRLTAVLVQAIKDQQVQIQALADRVTNLENILNP